MMPEISDMPPIFNRPLPVVDDLRRRMRPDYGFAEAVHGLLRDANIKVAVEGDCSAWSQEGQAVLLLGDHRQRVEYIPLTGAIGEMGRNDIHVLAKPYTRTAHTVGSLGVEAASVILPVVPNNLAADRHCIWNANLYYRILKRRYLPTEEQIRQNNSSSLQKCNALLHAGRMINVYPTGAIRNALKAPWYRGVGSIIKNMTQEDRNSTMIVPFRFDGFSITGLLKRLKLYQQGKSPSTLELCLRLGRQGTPNMLLGNNIDKLDATDITEALRIQFVEAFAKQGN